VCSHPKVSMATGSLFPEGNGSEGVRASPQSRKRKACYPLTPTSLTNPLSLPSNGYQKVLGQN